MMKLFIKACKWFCFMSLLSSNPAFSAFRIVQFNIQELDSVKIQTQVQTSPQLEAVKVILKKLQPDILSLNEIQYDKPSVPNSNFISQGDNVSVFAKNILGDSLKYHIFFPANTGNLALRNSNNEYVRNPSKNDVLHYADGVNFGMFPAQYSTAGLSKFPILDIKQINKLSWKDFNPSIDLSLYEDQHGKTLPYDMPLFDKNFTDATLLVNGRPVHLILLHTVPHYHFDNPKSANFERNRDQLLFLQQYLNGDLNPSLHIQPLQKNESFIAVGDWNVDINEHTESSAILKSLGKRYHFANDLKIPTFRGMDIFNNNLILHLDYILLSNDLGVSNRGVFSPKPNFRKLGCQNKNYKSDKFILVQRKEGNQVCTYQVEKNYYFSKIASDHLATWADIYFKK